MLSHDAEAPCLVLYSICLIYTEDMPFLPLVFLRLQSEKDVYHSKMSDEAGEVYGKSLGKKSRQVVLPEINNLPLLYCC